MLAANTGSVGTKRAAIQHLVTAYVAKMKQLEGSKPEFARAVATLTGLDPEISLKIADVIKLGPVLTPAQLSRQAKAFSDLAVIPRDVSAEIEKFWDASFLANAVKS